MYSYNRYSGGYNRVVTMTWGYDRFTGRLVRQLTPNCYTPGFDPNEGWS